MLSLFKSSKMASCLMAVIILSFRGADGAIEIVGSVVGSSLIGNDRILTNAHSSTIIGNNNKVSGNNNTVMGIGLKVDGYYNYVCGVEIIVKGKYNKIVGMDIEVEHPEINSPNEVRVVQSIETLKALCNNADMLKLLKQQAAGAASNVEAAESSASSSGSHGDPQLTSDDGPAPTAPVMVQEEIGDEDDVDPDGLMKPPMPEVSLTEILQMIANSPWGQYLNLAPPPPSSMGSSYGSEIGPTFTYPYQYRLVPPYGPQVNSLFTPFNYPFVSNMMSALSSPMTPYYIHPTSMRKTPTPRIAENRSYLNRERRSKSRLQLSDDERVNKVPLFESFGMATDRSNDDIYQVLGDNRDIRGSRIPIPGRN